MAMPKDNNTTHTARPLPSIMNGPELTAESGMSRSTIWRLECNDAAFAACRIRKGHRCWSRARLIAGGFLTGGDQ